MPWQITQLQLGDQRLDSVVSIWGANRSTLGLFPRGAFDDCVAQGRLAVALDSAGTVVGYLAFRVQRRLNSAAIIHLCVREENRGAGAADALADWLKSHSKTRGLSALRLKCRRDYHAEGLWQRLGFVARGDVAGRGRDADQLTVWVHSLGPTDDLFSYADQSDEDTKLNVVIDANVFFDLHGEDAALDKESRVLLEPWVDDAVKLHVADELHNEINRHTVAEERETYHRVANNYPEIQYDQTRAAGYLTSLDQIMGKAAATESEKSDRKQLAHAAAGDADIFLTRDKELIAAASDIYARLDIRVMRPSDLAGGLDETERTSAYRPSRLVATSFTHCAVRATEIDSLVSRVQLSGLGEKATVLAATLRTHLTKVRANPQSELNVVRSPEGEIAALIVRVRPADDGDGIISFLRIPRMPLDRTLARHLLLHAVQTNAHEGRVRLVIEDKFLTALVVEALLELGFARSERGWIRHTPAIMSDRNNLIAALEKRGVDSAPLVLLPASEVEAHYWPAKLLKEGISCYIIPIAPTWAAQLFDSTLAAGELFGAFARLALNRENVYYRSAKNGSFTLPARLLWYVKKEDAVPGTMAVRACSRLISVETGPAKALYAKHRRLGIYEWREVIATAKDDPMGEIMALRFADTEQFSTSVEVTALRDIGITSTFQSPTKITEDQFEYIYRAGTKK